MIGALVQLFDAWFQSEVDRCWAEIREYQAHQERVHKVKLYAAGWPHNARYIDG